MSRNITPLTEISKTLLDSVQINVSTADLIVGFPIHAPDGSDIAPVYSFASNTDTGLFRASTGVSVVVDAEVGMVCGSSSNVAVGTTPTNYGGGAGVLFLTDASVDPIGSPSDPGGILYVSGTNLVFLNASGTTTTLTSAGTSDVTGSTIPSSNNEVVRYTDTTGKRIGPSGVFYNGTQLLAGSGTASIPSYSFTSDPDTGMYLNGSTFAFSVGSGLKMSLASNATTFSVPVSVVDGAAATPALTFSSDTSSGVYFADTDVGFASGGVGGARTGAFRNSVLSSAVSSGFGTSASGVVKIATCTVAPVGIPNAGSGGLLYVTSLGTQMRWVDATGSDVLLGVGIPGVGTVTDNQLLVWGDATASSIVPRTVISNAGAIAAVQSATLTNPAYSFTGDTTTGLALASTGHLRVVCATTSIADITSSALTFNAPAYLQSPSSVAAPSMSFSSAPTTGMVNTGTNDLVVSYLGTGVARFDTLRNVSVCDSGNGFAGGTGMFALPDATTNPTTAPVDGGFLYVDGVDLKWRDATNTEVTITNPSAIGSIVSSTDNAIVRFSGTGGVTVKNSTAFISDTAQITVVAAEGYRFSSSTTSGMFSSGVGTMAFASAGTTGLTCTSSSVTVAPTHVVAGIDGTATIPSFGFTSDPNTGLYLASANTAALSAGGAASVTTAPNNNVAFGADTPDFAGGQGVVYISDVTTVPSGTLASGGILFVSGTDLYFHADDGTQTNLTASIGKIRGEGTNDAIVRFIDTSGQTVDDASAFTITDGGQILAPDSIASAPSYSLSLDTGMSLNAGTLMLGDGAAHLSVSNSAIVASVLVAADDVLRVGGTSGMTESFSASTCIRNINDASGTFVWQQNGISIMQTDTNRNLNMLTNNVDFLGATSYFTINYNGTRNQLSVVDGADSLIFRLGATDVATFNTSANATFNNLEISTGRFQNITNVTYGYGFIDSDVAGFDNATNSFFSIRCNQVTGISACASRQSFLIRTDSNVTVPSGNVCLTIGSVITAPSVLPSSGNGVYMYVDGATEFLRVANANKDVTVNGPKARAKFTRNAIITTGATNTLIDSLVNDINVTNILVVDTANPGTGTVTGTADTAGWWEVCAEAHWVSNATGYRKVRILIDDVEVAIATQNAVTGAETQQQVNACVNVGTNAVMTVRVEQTSGGNLNVDVTASAIFLG